MQLDHHRDGEQQRVPQRTLAHGQQEREQRPQ
jgi:hypothetical protein